MVVDTATLMNKESRKALQLLQGLRGTQLIIPKLGNVFLKHYLPYYLLFEMKWCSQSSQIWLSFCNASHKGTGQYEAAVLNL